LRGAVYTYIRNGKEVTATWPQPRGKGVAQKTKEQMEIFRQQQLATKLVSPDQMFNMVASTKGSPLLPRDLFTMMWSGRMFKITMPDGRVIWSRQAMNDVSKSLDTLSQTDGYTLVREDGLWIGKPYGGGGGGGPWWFDPPHTAQFPVQLNPANFTAVDDVDVGLILSTSDVGADPRGCFKVVPPGTSFTAQIQQETFFQAGGYANAGMAVGNAALDRIVGFTWDCRYKIHVTFWTGGAYGGSEWFYDVGGPIPKWFKIDYNAGTGDMQCFNGNDGKTWSLVNVTNVAAWLGGTVEHTGMIVTAQAYGHVNNATFGNWADNF
jgi:hypothetical protein